MLSATEEEMNKEKIIKILVYMSGKFQSEPQYTFHMCAFEFRIPLAVTYGCNEHTDTIN
jgi:hypothetical protein